MQVEHGAESIRTLSAAELGFVDEPSQTVVGFVLPTDDESSGSPKVRVSDLAEAVRLAGQTEIVVFLYADTMSEDVRFVPSLMAAFDTGTADVAIRSAPAVDAIKRVDGRFVIEAVDRTTVNLLLAPELITASSLEAALSRADGEAIVNPSVLAWSHGATVQIVEL